MRQLELEAKANHISQEEATHRLEKKVHDLSVDNESLKSTNTTLTNQLQQYQDRLSSSLDNPSELANLRQQIQDLSKQLLRKQAQFNDVQAEKLAYSSRFQDMQNKYVKLE